MVKIIQICLWAFTCSLVLLPKFAQANPVNRIVELTGEAQIQRVGSTNYQRAFTGMTLNLGDILLPDEGAVVKVRCSDRRLRSAQAGVMSGLKTICPGSRNTDARVATPIFIDLLEEDFVYQTLVLTDKPLLSWSSVSGATGYQVQIKAGEQIIWSQTVEDTSVFYSGEPLRPKFFYQLVVEAIDGKDSSPYQLQLRRTERGFLIEEEVEKIKLESVSEEVQALLLADYYLEQQDELKSGFLLAASQPLEKLVQQGDRVSFVHRLLGDIYLRLGRLQEAQESYQQTLSLAESEQNWEEIAKAQAGLAHVAVINGNLSEARELLIEAQEFYRLSENSEQVDLIQGWLVKLEEKMKRLNSSQLLQNKEN